MVKDFKFLHIKKSVLTNTVFYKLKDRLNRDRSFLIKWCQFPNTYYDDINTRYLEFNGNILEFYNLMEPFNVIGAAIIPTVYEIYFERRGYHSHSISYGNHHQLREFISRGWKLKIIYTID
jgi:hypothetical protein